MPIFVRNALNLSQRVAVRCAQLEMSWERDERWRGVTRRHTTQEVVELQGSISPTPIRGNGEGETQLSGAPHARLMANKLFALLREKRAVGKPTVTFGAIDPVQAVQMAARGVETVYASGWIAAQAHATTNEPGPDLADYPMNTVPNHVDRLVRAQRWQDRVAFQEAVSSGASQLRADFLRPIVADADTGHGGPTAVLKLCKMFAEAGAAGVHLEDQRNGVKGCGHMANLCVVPTREHEERLSAARLAFDIAGTPTLIVARTDANGAPFLDSNVDSRDHRFIVGTRVGYQADRMAPMDAQGTFPEIAERALRANRGDQAAEDWRAHAARLGPALSWEKAHELYSSLSGGHVAPEWSAEPLRDERGFYKFRGGVDACVDRARAFAPLADILWMETKNPDLREAEQFATGVRAAFPDKILAYNLSPSFNWDKSGMTDEEMSAFIDRLGVLGFNWQFITLGGFHGTGLVADRLARAFAIKRDMMGYVRDVQRAEREEGVELLTHQRWSGANFVDRMVNVLKGKGSDAEAARQGVAGDGCTESQFR